MLKLRLKPHQLELLPLLYMFAPYLSGPLSQRTSSNASNPNNGVAPVQQQKVSSSSKY